MYLLKEQNEILKFMNKQLVINISNYNNNKIKDIFHPNKNHLIWKNGNKKKMKKER